MFRLPPGEVQLWLIPEQYLDEEKALDVLSPEELLRYRRFLFPADQGRFLLTRFAIRTLLSLHAEKNVMNASWEFSRGQHGRPELLHDQAGQVSFNISHTDGLIAIAISPGPDAEGGEVGVDVENLAKERRYLSLAARYFSAKEARALEQLSGKDLRKQFYAIWTLKEAWLKAAGTGLSVPLRLTEFSLEKAADSLRVNFAPELDEDPGRWQFWQLPVKDSHCMAVALKTKQGSRPFSLKIHQWHAHGQYKQLTLPFRRTSAADSV